MRSWLLTLLAVLITLQFSWAAAASVCAHEARNASHFGHHAHGHEADSDTVQDEATPSTQTFPSLPDVGGGGGGDHAHCHLSALALPSVPPLALPAASPAAQAPDSGPAPRSHIPEGLDRPQWLRA